MAGTGAHTLRIGDLAQATGFSPQTIRFYEKAGLLQQPERSESGYRSYSEPDVERLVFIRKAKAFEVDPVWWTG